MPEIFYDIPVTLRIKATGVRAPHIDKTVRGTDFEDFTPDAFPLERDGVRLEIQSLAFPGADDMEQTEEDPY